jgi:hypothetical protein
LIFVRPHFEPIDQHAQQTRPMRTHDPTDLRHRDGVRDSHRASSDDAVWRRANTPGQDELVHEPQQEDAAGLRGQAPRAGVPTGRGDIVSHLPPLRRRKRARRAGSWRGSSASCRPPVMANAARSRTGCRNVVTTPCRAYVPEDTTARNLTLREAAFCLPQPHPTADPKESRPEQRQGGRLGDGR